MLHVCNVTLIVTNSSQVAAVLLSSLPGRHRPTQLRRRWCSEHAVICDSHPRGTYNRGSVKRYSVIHAAINPVSKGTPFHHPRLASIKAYCNLLLDLLTSCAHQLPPIAVF